MQSSKTQLGQFNATHMNFQNNFKYAQLAIFPHFSISHTTKSSSTCNALSKWCMPWYAMQYNANKSNPKPMPNETKSPPQGPNSIEPRALIPSCHALDFKPG